MKCISYYRNLTKQLVHCFSGKKIIQKYVKTGKNIYIFPHKSLGDIYILGLFKKNDPNFFGKDYRLMVVGESCAIIAKKCGFNNVLVVNEDEMSRIIHYIMINGEENVGCKVLHFLYYHTSIMYEIINYTKMNFLQCYEQLVFKEKLKDIKETETRKTSKLLEKYGITKEAIVISPFAKSVVGFSDEFWNNLVLTLKSEGYKKLYTNCGYYEYPIYGTEKLDVSLDNIFDVIDCIGVFIGIRSGLCDLISTCNCKKVIFYPDSSYIKDSLNYYSLKLLPGVKNIREFTIKDEYLPYANMLEFIKGTDED